MRVLLALMVLVAGCGASEYTLSRKALSGADLAAIAGAKAFGEFDDLHQHAILQAKETDADFRAEITAYHALRAKVRIGLRVLEDALHVAKATIDAAEKQSTGLNIASLLGTVYTAGLQLYDAASALGVKFPGLDVFLGHTASVPGSFLFINSGSIPALAPIALARSVLGYPAPAPIPDRGVPAPRGSCLKGDMPWVSLTLATGERVPVCVSEVLR